MPRAQINQITKMRLPGTDTEVAFVDWTDKPLWSTIEVLHATATQEMNFFQYVVGDSVPAFAPVAITAQRTANEMDTNLANPGAMGSTEEMLVYALRPEVFRLNVSDAEAPNFAAPAALTANQQPIPTPTMLAVLGLRTLLSFEISQKVYAQAGFGYFNWGAGVWSAGDALGVNNNGGGVAQAGLPAQGAVRSLAIPQHIGGQEKFRVYLTHLDDGTGDGIELGQQGPAEASESPGEDTTRFARIRVFLDGLYKRPVS